MVVVVRGPIPPNYLIDALSEGSAPFMYHQGGVYIRGSSRPACKTEEIRGQWKVRVQPGRRAVAGKTRST